KGLIALGHDLKSAADSYMDFGAGQFIVRCDNGYVAASDPRSYGQAAGFWPSALALPFFEDLSRMHVLPHDARSIGFSCGERCRRPARSETAVQHDARCRRRP